MSERRLTFKLTELEIVRLRCLACDKTAVMRLNDLGTQMFDPVCPFCTHRFALTAGHGSPFPQLARAIHDLKLSASHVELAFEVPEPAK